MKIRLSIGLLLLAFGCASTKRIVLNANDYILPSPMKILISKVTNSNEVGLYALEGLYAIPQIIWRVEGWCIWKGYSIFILFRVVQFVGIHGFAKS
jgi:hypothetical protein